MPKLRVIDGPHSGEVFELAAHRVLAGRDLNNAIYLPDGLVSRHHAEFVQKGQTFVVRDLDSTNGTFLNDQPITEAELKDGDIVKLADVVMRFEADTVFPPPQKSPPSSLPSEPSSAAQTALTPAIPVPASTRSEPAGTRAPAASPAIPKLRRDPVPQPPSNRPAQLAPQSPTATKTQEPPQISSPAPHPSPPPADEIVIVEAPPRKIAPFLITSAAGVLVLIAGYTLDANALRFWGLVLLIVGLLCTFRDWTPLPPKPREP
ncbi:MAG: FHA domain-containing protein [Verrucomicrobiae bacterium]|nr:FHA domain-containing protein [Verrucomicrobiae bacterium]